MDLIIQEFFNLEIMILAAPLLLKGLGMTAALCAVIIPLGMVAGMALALAATQGGWLLRVLIVIYVDFFRALPPLVLLILIYAGLPFAGVELSPFMAVIAAFLLNNSSFYTEVFRAGIGSVGAGQWEAGRSTGLGFFPIVGFVVIPQAVRNILPDLISNTIEIVKLTSLASVVALAELLFSADMARSVTYNSSPLTLAALAYLIILWPCVRLLSRFENKVR